MQHEKVTGLPNTHPTKVGGGHWDAPHLHGLGDIFVMGIVQANYDPVDAELNVIYRHGRFVGLFTQVSTGVFHIEVDQTALPVVAGLTQWDFYALNIVPRGTIPAGHYFTAERGVNGATEGMFVRCFDAAGDPVDPAIIIDVVVTAYMIPQVPD